MIRSLILAVAFVVLPGTAAAQQVAAAGSVTKYTDPMHFSAVPFGARSHWLQPWRAYLETVPASRLVDGLGVVFNDPGKAKPRLVAEMLARHGIRNARVEIGWDSLDFDKEARLRESDRVTETLLALRDHGIRPLILLNANHGGPCPLRRFTRTLLAEAVIGTSEIVVDDPRGIRVGYVGIDQDGIAAQTLVTKISGNVLTLSSPLAGIQHAGQPVTLTELRYRPFGPPATREYEETMQGWLRYVDTVAKFATGALGTEHASDRGFDLEVWNELSFGSAFLRINEYYRSSPYDYAGRPEIAITGALVERTAAHAAANPDRYRGVDITDGMANTTPWPAASVEHPRIAAISKHPYAGRHRYRVDGRNDEQGTQPVDALGRPDAARFTPSYTALFPEYTGSAIDTETLIRDMGSLASDVYGTMHGRDARAGGPVSVWITEWNLAPSEDDPRIDRASAEAVKAKAIARAATFFLQKGAGRLYLYAAKGSDSGLGVVRESFFEYAQQRGGYPDDDAAYVSPALAVLDVIRRRVSVGLDRSPSRKRQITVEEVSDDHGRAQFEGDGTEAHPALYDRDVLALLPFQVNSNRVVIPYYVMTRDVMASRQPGERAGRQYDLPAEHFTVRLSGVAGRRAKLSVFDPFANQQVPFAVRARTDTSISVLLRATDRPFLLTIDDAKPTKKKAKKRKSRPRCRKGTKQRSARRCRR